LFDIEFVEKDLQTWIWVLENLSMHVCIPVLSKINSWYKIVARVMVI